MRRWLFKNVMVSMGILKKIPKLIYDSAFGFLPPKTIANSRMEIMPLNSILQKGHNFVSYTNSQIVRIRDLSWTNYKGFESG